MKATPYRSVRDGVITRMGIDPAQPLLSSQGSALAEYLTSAAATAWNFFDWPATTHTERRVVYGLPFSEGTYTYESDYTGTISYIGRAAQGSLFTDAVWRIKRVVTTGDGQVLNIDTAIDVPWNDRTTATYVEDSSNGGADDILPYIPLYSVGQLPIGEVQAIFDDSPNLKTHAKKLEYVATEDRLILIDPAYAGGDVYVRFQVPCPKFTATAYNAAISYSVGDLVYHAATGDCYEAIREGAGNAPTNEEFWLRQKIPTFMADYLKAQAFAETLAEDGQYDKSQFQFARAEGLLMKAMDDAWLRKGAVRNYSASFDFQ